ncbi:MAG: endonuclease/exonuclease/phosphatase family protein [Phycisphaeraceae bacterium]
MIYRCLMLVFVISLLLGCSTTPEPPSEPLCLRVLTYNIHHGRGADGVIDLQRLADVIKRAEPDLVALQEVDVKTKRSGGVDQAATLGELTGMHHYFAEAMPFQGGGYGNAILSKTRNFVQYGETVALRSAPGDEPRAMAVAEMDLSGGESPDFSFASTHLCHMNDATRLSQVGQINNDSYEHDLGAAILAGDFNFTPDSKPYRAMIDAGWVDTAAAFGDPKHTCPADKPTMRIDYVFIRPADRWRVIDVQVIDEPVASDHAPVLVVLEYIIPR